MTEETHCDDIITALCRLEKAPPDEAGRLHVSRSRHTFDSERFLDCARNDRKLGEPAEKNG